MKQKGQIQIVFGIIVILVIVGAVIGFKFLGKSEEAEPSEPESGEEVIGPPEGEGFPVRSNLYPSGTLPAGTTETKISVNTNEPGYCRYSKEPGKTYDEMTSRFTYDKAKTFHSAQVKYLKDGQTYRHYVRCRDLPGNRNSDDAVIEFSIGGTAPGTGPSAPSAEPGKVPPIRSNLLPTGILPAGTRDTTISVNTNEPGYCRYSKEPGKTYDSMKGRFSYNKAKTFHSAKATGLIDNRIHEYFVRCRDLKGNKNTDDAIIQFGVGGVSVPVSPPGAPGQDLTPPYRYEALPDEDLPVGTLQATISLKTDEKAFCRYSTVSGMSYDSMTRLFTNTGGLSHSTLVTGLTEGREHKYYIKCVDQERNKNKDDFLISFKVEAVEDAIPPLRRNLEPSGTLPAGTTETTISCSTNEPAYCRYSAEQGKSYDEMKYSFSRNETKTYHTKTIKGLEDGKPYDFFVRCKDLEGNKNTGDVMIRFSIGL